MLQTILPSFNAISLTTILSIYTNLKMINSIVFPNIPLNLKDFTFEEARIMMKQEIDILTVTPDFYTSWKQNKTKDNTNNILTPSTDVKTNEEFVQLV
jgi:hypothetical protein